MVVKKKLNQKEDKPETCECSACGHLQNHYRFEFHKNRKPSCEVCGGNVQVSGWQYQGPVRKKKRKSKRSRSIELKQGNESPSEAKAAIANPSTSDQRERAERNRKSREKKKRIKAKRKKYREKALRKWPKIEVQTLERDQNTCVFCDSKARKAIPLTYRALIGLKPEAVVSTCLKCFVELKLIGVKKRWDYAEKFALQHGKSLEEIRVRNLAYIEKLKADKAANVQDES